MGVKGKYKTTWQRIQGKFLVGNDCWTWIGYKDKDGYGNFAHHDGNHQRIYRAHRATYEAFIGEIPSGMVLDHLCRNRSCVNPYHLEPVTPKENTMRGNTLAAKNSRKTSCKNGHDYTTKTLYVYFVNNRPKRECRICRNNSAKRYLERKEKIRVNAR